MAHSLRDTLSVVIDRRYAVEKVNRAGMAVREQAQGKFQIRRSEVVISDTYLLARLAD